MIKIKQVIPQFQVRALPVQLRLVTNYSSTGFMDSRVYSKYDKQSAWEWAQEQILMVSWVTLVQGANI